MGSIFRSEELAFYQLFLEPEASFTCVAELGELGLVEFRDMNSEVNLFQRKYVNEVRRCNEMERKLLYILREIKKNYIPIPVSRENPEVPHPKEMTELENAFDKIENELHEVNQNAKALKRNYLELTELKHVLRKTQILFEESDENSLYNSSVTELNGNEDEIALLSERGLQSGERTLKLNFVTGVILREKIPNFERMLWRAGRGNIFLRQSEIEAALEDPSTEEMVRKHVIIIFFQGEQLKTRVKKICEGFHATLYPCPDSATERREMSAGVMARINDLKIVLSQTEDHRYRVLVAASRNIKKWLIKARKLKAVYHALNMFSVDLSKKLLIAECWLPVADEETIKFSLNMASDRSGCTLRPVLNRMDAKEDPPTYNKTNKFTHGFQVLIDAYGIATYREINPVPYTVITFPFLFAVMFGDIGHGVIMTMFAAWMVIREKSLADRHFGGEIWNIFFGGRYIILLMGIFSIYTGFIYNDIFSKTLNIFGSRWYINYNESTIMNCHSLQLNPNSADYHQTPYPFGVDPAWHLAENSIIFTNSYKMKISIIIGVLHMIFGLFLSFSNHIYFKKKINIFCEFLPQLIFLSALFLYLCVLMFVKWILYGPGKVKQFSSYCAPSILISFINMLLFKKSEHPEGCNPHMYPGELMVEKALIIIALICIPWMLLIKPFMIWRHQVKHHPVPADLALPLVGDEEQSILIVTSVPRGTVTTMVKEPRTQMKEEEETDLEMSEIIIHQCIHTIEFVLGTVSHTASYLRLWALSLAHSQLSDVLWSMVLATGLRMNAGFVGAVVIWIVFAIWAVLTIGILVLMEGLSAFLHTLRLHWVEFQSKFYHGLGYAFQPFSFKTLVITSLDVPEE